MKYIILYLYIYNDCWLSSIIVRVFANGLEDLGLIPG